MLRSAAKNHKFVTVVTDPADYTRVVDCIAANKGNTTAVLRLELAQKVFARQALYDAAIAHYLAAQIPGTEGARPIVISYTDGVKLRYGENPHQDATFYKEQVAQEATIAHAEILHGKEMSYNNYLDADSAVESVRELSGVPAVSIIKHNNPCGYATGKSLAAAFEAAWAGDIVSAFGSVIAVTVPVDEETARLLEDRFVEVMIAPDYEPAALEFLRQKSKNLRLLKLNKPLAPATKGLAIRQINGGLLVQDRNLGVASQWMVPTSTPFPEDRRPLAEFGVKACKHVRSNAITIVREYEPGQFSMIGMGAGQPNRVDALRKLAVTKAQENMGLLYEKKSSYGKTPTDFYDSIMKECVLVSDAFFPFPDNIVYAAEAGIRYIVQPGGSKKDEEIIAACDEYGIAMAFTGMRHFKH
jgi:phosphoribosylaminoimidazolecarboxamide formyltransferase/IMP cyclohydrolase